MYAKCENCNIENNGKYGSGRFCGSKCARSFSTKLKRKEISEKVSKTFTLKTNKLEKVCCICNKSFLLPWKKRHQKTCSRECGSKLGNSQEKKRESLRKSRIKEIEKGNIGFGKKCFLNGVRCDSALEYAFLKMYWRDNPNSKIERFKGFLQGKEIKYQPDFLIDDKIIVEVKYNTSYIGENLSSKWKHYVESQEEKLELLKNSGYDYLWITNDSIGNKFYRDALKELTLT
jgi:hypothetical protein